MSENFKTSCSLKRKSVYRGAGGGESLGCKRWRKCGQNDRGFHRSIPHYFLL